MNPLTTKRRFQQYIDDLVQLALEQTAALPAPEGDAVRRFALASIYLAGRYGFASSHIAREVASRLGITLSPSGDLSVDDPPAKPQ